MGPEPGGIQIRGPHHLRALVGPPPPGCELCPCPSPWDASLSSPIRQDVAAQDPVSIRILLGWASLTAPSHGPGCEPQDFTCNRYPENMWGTEMGPVSVSPAYTSASAIHSHLPRASQAASCWGCDSGHQLSLGRSQSVWADGR